MPDEYKKRRIYLKGEDKTDDILDIKPIGSRQCGVKFKGGKYYIYNANNVVYIQSVLNEKKSRDCFEYLKCVASAIGLVVEVEDGKKINILAHNYSKIDFILPDSMLGAFLCGQLPEPKGSELVYRTDGTREPVYPFGFNASQKDAVEKALNNKVSIIQGPPGTGKTQTILNIIANAVMHGESVAVVSGNNSATRNVLEKLKKYDVDFIAAYLGNSDNKKDFINSQKPLPDLSKWKLNLEDIVSAYSTLKILYGSLRKKLAQKNELSVLKQELDSIEIERKYFLQYANVPFKEIELKPETPQKALEMWFLCETYKEGKTYGPLIRLIRYILFLLGIGRENHKLRKLFEKYPQEQLIVIFQHYFYELKIIELKKNISALTETINSFNFDEKMTEYSDISMRLFRSSIAGYFATRKRTTYELDDLWKKSEDFIKNYPVILSTTYSLRSSLAKNVMYDYVIIDESSQVDLCTGALALSCARKAVVVGDLKQLPNVVNPEDSALTDAIFTKFDLPGVYRYKNHSLLSTVSELFPKAPSTLLREHYRCNPKIIEFCNKKFYDNQLVILTDPKSSREPLVMYKTVEGNHERNHVNQRQIDVIKNEVIPQQNLNINDHSLGIVTPYRNQTNALQQAFKGTGIKADTVDKFQGQENKIIILSTVDNDISEFADNANRLNVAISRAIDQLIVVVSNSDMRRDTNIGDLVKYIQYNNFSVIESEVFSVFDYLYKNYAKRRFEFLKKQKRISEYDSENIMYALIADVLENERFHKLDIATHVPLRMIIRDMCKLSAHEKQYVMNILTHIDFLVFDKIGKVPLLAIEVDGAAFHEEGSRQAERDMMKNNILMNYKLPFVRFRTDESNERKRLTTALDNVLNNA